MMTVQKLINILQNSGISPEAKVFTNVSTAQGETWTKGIAGISVRNNDMTVVLINER